MLQLTRLNGHPMAINGDLIKSVESSPDTMITLVTGEKIVVLETLEQVVEKARAWRVDLLRETLSATDTAAALAQKAASSAAASAANIAHNAAPGNATDRQHK